LLLPAVPWLAADPMKMSAWGIKAKSVHQIGRNSN
jgi:hypothetical protein